MHFLQHSIGNDTDRCTLLKHANVQKKNRRCWLILNYTKHTHTPRTHIIFKIWLNKIHLKYKEERRGFLINSLYMCLTVTHECALALNAVIQYTKKMPSSLPSKKQQPYTYNFNNRVIHNINTGLTMCAQ